jgi:hypothetical protein
MSSFSHFFLDSEGEYKLFTENNQVVNFCSRIMDIRENLAKLAFFTNEERSERGD